MPDRSAATPSPIGNAGWRDGSYLIEKYVHATGVQWLAYVVRDGALVYLRPFKTRREAAEFVGGHRG